MPVKKPALKNNIIKNRNTISAEGSFCFASIHNVHRAPLHAVIILLSIDFAQYIWNPLRCQE